MPFIVAVAAPPCTLPCSTFTQTPVAYRPSVAFNPSCTLCASSILLPPSTLDCCATAPFASSTHSRDTSLISCVLCTLIQGLREPWMAADGLGRGFGLHSCTAAWRRLADRRGPQAGRLQPSAESRIASFPIRDRLDCHWEAGVAGFFCTRSESRVACSGVHFRYSSMHARMRLRCSDAARDNRYPLEHTAAAAAAALLGGASGSRDAAADAWLSSPELSVPSSPLQPLVAPNALLPHHRWLCHLLQAACGPTVG